MRQAQMPRLRTTAVPVAQLKVTIEVSKRQVF
jgi:hypothetical protein